METHYLNMHANFTTAEQLDRAVNLHMLQHNGSLTISDVAVLGTIRRHSEEHGAAHLPYSTIEAEIGRSNITVRRAIRKLVELKIIEKVHYIQPVMRGLGANIYVILPNVMVVDEQTSDGMLLQ